MPLRLVAASILGVLLALPAAAQPRASEVPLLVTTAWMAERLDDPSIVVLWSGQGEPGNEQIRGARAVPHATLMTSHGGHDLATTDSLVSALADVGVSNSSHVVVYGEPLAAGWLFFALEYLGHARVSMLDGGIEKWRAEGRPVAAPSRAAARGRFTPSVRPALKASVDDVRGARERRTTLLDARTPKEYEGGRIPGARLVFFRDVYADPQLQTFKSRDALAALFQTAGAAPGAKAITYCQIGLRSSLLYFAARYAGLDVSNYIGSWREWTEQQLPVESPR
jgi:thiosulfate/3-mercaptopyruvate sulfurtransferase